MKKILISSNLLVVKKLALSSQDIEHKNARGVASSSPKCKWFQWACVFWWSSANLPVLLAYYLANQFSPLAILVADYGLNYIAQCCPGFCLCQCPAGCPTIFS